MMRLFLFLLLLMCAPFVLAVGGTVLAMASSFFGIFFTFCLVAFCVCAFVKWVIY